MDDTNDYVGKAEAEAVKRGDVITLQPPGKNWAEFFDSAERGSLLERVQPPLQDREGAR